MREVAENGGPKTPSRTGIVLGHGCCEKCESGQGFSPGSNFREDYVWVKAWTSQIEKLLAVMDRATEAIVRRKFNLGK